LPGDHPGGSRLQAKNIPEEREKYSLDFFFASFLFDQAKRKRRIKGLVQSALSLVLSLCKFICRRQAKKEQKYFDQAKRMRENPVVFFRYFSLEEK
jgi:hypothetical protein